MATVMYKTENEAQQAQQMGAMNQVAPMNMMQPTMLVQAPMIGPGGAFSIAPQAGGQAVIVMQPGMQQQSNRYDLTGIRDWSSGICDCFSNCGLCLYSYCCLECVVFDVVNSLGESVYLGLCCGAGAGPIVRATVRHRYRIQGTLVRDMAVYGCCGDGLVWQQLYRELKANGDLTPCCPCRC
jgi:Cys-rich protein (TIGR01571 family)